MPVHQGVKPPYSWAVCILIRGRFSVEYNVPCWCWRAPRARGYGQNRFARMNGDLLDMYDWLWYDDNGDNINDGVYIWWDASGYPYGTFTYESTSPNYPWNTMSDSIYIN